MRPIDPADQPIVADQQQVRASSLKFAGLNAPKPFCHLLLCAGTPVALAGARFAVTLYLKPVKQFATNSTGLPRRPRGRVRRYLAVAAACFAAVTCTLVEGVGTGAK